MTARLSIVIPTIGRKGLLHVLERAKPDLGPGDEILVVGDGARPRARAMAEGFHPQVRYLEYGPTRCWGHPQRNFAMLLATGTHLYSIDDDDEPVNGFVQILRKAADEEPSKILVFRIHHREMILPLENSLWEGNVSTQCFLVPLSAPLGTWGFRYAGDFDFISSTRERSGLELSWRPEIIAIHGDASLPQHAV